MEERRLRGTYGGKALGILYLASRAEELGYRVPPFELIPISFFDGFLECNGISREELAPIEETGEQRMDSSVYKMEAEQGIEALRSQGIELTKEQVGEIFRAHRKIFLKENRARKKRRRAIEHRNSPYYIMECFTNGSFSPEQERELLGIFRRLRSTMNGRQVPIILSTSSVKEDDRENQFKGVYESQFVITTYDERGDFANFLKALKIVFASIFLPKARRYREFNEIPDEDRMTVVAKHVIGGEVDGIFSPETSGVTLFHPYSPDTVFHSVNPGLNTKTVRGEAI